MPTNSTEPRHHLLFRRPAGLHARHRSGAQHCLLHFHRAGQPPRCPPKLAALVRSSAAVGAARSPPAPTPAPPSSSGERWRTGRQVTAAAGPSSRTATAHRTEQGRGRHGPADRRFISAGGPPWGGPLSGGRDRRIRAPRVRSRVADEWRGEGERMGGRGDRWG
jgi:hypothetical protein